MYHLHFTHSHEFLNIVPIIMFLYHSYQKLCHTSKTYQNLQETLITQILSSPFFFLLPLLIIFLKHLTFYHFSLYLATLTNHLNTTTTTSFISIWQVNVPPNLTNSETYHQTTNILLHNQVPFLINTLTSKFHSKLSLYQSFTITRFSTFIISWKIINPPWPNHPLNYLKPLPINTLTNKNSLQYQSL